MMPGMNINKLLQSLIKGSEALRFASATQGGRQK